jgi:hypothetical protein
MVFRLENLHDCRSQHCLPLDLISDFFFETSKWYFRISKNELHVARATFVVFDGIHAYVFPWINLKAYMRAHGRGMAASMNAWIKLSRRIES